MKYLTIEIQTASDGSVANLTTVHETRATAESAFYSVLAAAAISTLPVHGCVLIDSEGQLLNTACYKNGSLE